MYSSSPVSPIWAVFFPPIVIVLMLILNFSSFSSNTKLLEIVVHTCLYLTLLITVSIHSRLAIMFKLNENCSYNSYQSPLTATQLLFMLLLCYFVADDTLTISYQGHLGPWCNCLLTLLPILSLLVFYLQTWMLLPKQGSYALVYPTVLSFLLSVSIYL